MKEEAAQLPDERKPLRDPLDELSPDEIAATRDRILGMARGDRKPLRNPLDEPTPEEIQVAKDDMRELFNERHGISNKPLAEPPEPLQLEPVQAPDWVRATNAMHRELVELRSEIDLLKAPPGDEFIENGLEFPGDTDTDTSMHQPFDMYTKTANGFYLRDYGATSGIIRMGGLAKTVIGVDGAGYSDSETIAYSTDHWEMAAIVTTCWVWLEIDVDADTVDLWIGATLPDGSAEAYDDTEVIPLYYLPSSAAAIDWSGALDLRNQYRAWTGQDI